MTQNSSASMAGQTVFRGFSLPVFAILIVVFSIATFRRNTVWKGEIEFWSDVVMKSPLKVRGYSNLGGALVTREMYGDAIRHLKKAIAIDANYENPHYNLGVAYIETGLLTEAVFEFEEILRIEEFLSGGHYGYGRSPRSVVRANATLGNIYSMKGEHEKAIDHYNEALKFAPEDASTRYNLALAYKKTGKKDEAVREFEEVLKINPRDEGALWNMSVLKK